MSNFCIQLLGVSRGGALVQCRRFKNDYNNEGVVLRLSPSSNASIASKMEMKRHRTYHTATTSTIIDEIIESLSSTTDLKNKKPIHAWLQTICHNISDVSLNQISKLDAVLRMPQFIGYVESKAIRHVLPCALENQITTELSALDVNGKISLLLYVTMAENVIPKKNQWIEMMIKDLCECTDMLNLRLVNRILLIFNRLERDDLECIYTEYANDIIQQCTDYLIRDINQLSCSDMVIILARYKRLYIHVKDSPSIFKFCEMVADRFYESEAEDNFTQLINIQMRLRRLVKLIWITN